MKRPYYSTSLVTIQFACIFYFLLKGGGYARQPLPLLLQSGGLLLGILSIGFMRLRQLHIFPEPGLGQQLVVRGPYRLIRHPMYSAVLLFCGGLLVDRFSLFSLLVYLLLLADLLLKLHYEEKLLRTALPGYEAYCKKTRRLIPYLY